MSDRTQLDPGLGNVLFDVWLASRAVTAAIDAAIGDSGLDADEFAVYSMLASGDGITPTDLSNWMSAPMTTVSSYLKRFEQRRHIERTPHPEDGRSYLVRLTDEGRSVHQAAGSRFLPLLAAIDARLGDRGEPARESLNHIRVAVGRGRD